LDGQAIATAINSQTSGPIRFQNRQQQPQLRQVVTAALGVLVDVALLPRMLLLPVLKLQILKPLRRLRLDEAADAVRPLLRRMQVLRAQPVLRPLMRLRQQLQDEADGAVATPGRRPQPRLPQYR
jgi:hypothetical protein